jgi:hypothetical protein
MKILLAALLLAAAPPKAAPADRFCADLRSLAAAAEENPAFGSLAGASLHSLLGSYCMVSTPAGIAFLCTRSLAPPELATDTLVERMKLCLPGAVVTKGEYPMDSTRVEHGRIRMEISESGGPGAHVGRIVTVSIEAAE